jgi:thiamine kinase-like enzyme
METPGLQDIVSTLEHSLSARSSAPIRVVGIKRRPSQYASSFTLEELDVELAGGQRLALVLKHLGWETLNPAGRLAKPAFLYDPLREIETYQRVLSPLNLGTPDVYGAGADPSANRYWLLLERVAGAELYQIGELSQWQQVARWLARFHARSSAHMTANPPAPPLRWVRYGDDFYWRWLRRVRRFGESAERNSSQMQRLVTRLVASYDAVVRQLVAMPTTMIHGEFYASNVIVSSRHGILRICPVDWETTAIAPGLIDLAALTSGQWSAKDRTAIALAYHEVRAEAVGQVSPIAEFLHELDLCRLHLAVQWLGWSEDWKPPNDHRHDWLNEATELACELGL